MASGYFPLSKTDHNHQRLLAAAEMLKTVREEMRYEIAFNCTPEDAMSDGMFLERLLIAEEFIRYCMEGDAA